MEPVEKNDDDRSAGIEELTEELTEDDLDSIEVYNKPDPSQPIDFPDYPVKKRRIGP